MARLTCGGLMTYPAAAAAGGLQARTRPRGRLPEDHERRQDVYVHDPEGVRFSTGAPVTARSFAHTINRLLNPAMRFVLAQDYADIVGAQKVIDGKAETASGVIARGDTLIIRLKKPVGRLHRPRDTSLRRPGDDAHRPRGREGSGSGSWSVLRCRIRPRAAVRLERNRFYRGPVPHHVDRFFFDITGVDPATQLDRVDRGELDWAGLENRYTRPAPRSFAANMGSKGRASSPCRTETCGCSSSTRAEPCSRRNSSSGRRSTSPLTARRSCASVGPSPAPDRPVPATGHARLQERAHLPAHRSRREEGKAAREGAHAERQGRAVHLREPGRRRPGTDRQGQPAGKIGLDVEIEAFPPPVLFRSWRRRASRSTSAGIGCIGIDRSAPGSTVSSTAAASASQQPELLVLRLAEVQPAARGGRRASHRDRARPRLRRARRGASRGTPRRRSRLRLRQGLTLVCAPNRLRRRQPVPRPRPRSA